MSYDNRAALPENHNLIIKDQNSGNRFCLTILKEIGRGGSCIAYNGIQIDSFGNEKVERSVIVKEFYPKIYDTSISRNESFDLIIPENIHNDFEQKKDMFCRGLANHVVYANDNSDTALPPVSASGEGHNTFYAVSFLSKGSTLSRDNLTIIDALERAVSVCEAIGRIHNAEEKTADGKNVPKRSLYLDCKPDNIYVNGNKAYLFDFDTVQVWSNTYKYCSYSEGWSAPEQKIVEGIGYKDSRLIGFHTDVFSIGAVLFYMLTGANPPSDDDLDLVQNGFDWSKKITLTDTTDALSDDSFISELNRIMKTILHPDARIRKKTFGDLDAAEKAANNFRHIISLAENIPYRRGFKDTNQNITSAKKDIEDTIKKHSVKSLLFGSKKRVAVTISVFIVSALFLGVLFTLGGKVTEKIITGGQVEIETKIDEHILLKLSNANHQYEVGLENWRRLDYNRADRDIKTARQDFSEEKSQSELEIAKINNSLGCLYIDMGKYKDAYDYLNSAYVTFRDELGGDSVEARAVRLSIAQYYYYVGMLEEALTETQYILDSSDEKKEKSIITSTYHLRAMIFDAQGKYDDALILYNQVLELYGDISKDGKLSEQLANYANDPELSQNEKDYYTNAIRWIILTYNNIAVVNNHKGSYDIAIESAETGIKMSMDNIYIGQRNITTSKLYMNLAIAQGAMGDITSAIDSVDLAMRIQRNLFDFEDVFPGLVKVYDVYGTLLELKGDSDKAKEFYESAVDLAMASFGMNHPDTAEAYHALGLCYFENENLDTAVSNLRQAIEIRKNILAENHPDTAQMYYDLGIAQIASDDPSAAKKSLKNALDICENWKIEGELYDDVKTALKSN